MIKYTNSMQKEITISTSKRLDLVDISHEIEKAIKESKIKNGICTVYVPHATAAVIINENYVISHLEN